MHLPVPSRSLTLTAVACLSALLAGCRAKTGITQAQCVGTYEYYSEGKAMGTACFTLHADGTYVLGKSQGQQPGLSFFRLNPAGPWHISSDEIKQRLLIDQVTIPIKSANGTLSAMMNNDHGVACNLVSGTNTLE